jgi:DNA-binding NtrC family response regulator
VLLLEDDVVFRDVLLELLEAEALDVSICETYAALRDYVRTDHSVVVLADFWGSSHTELSPQERDEIRDLGEHAPTILLTGRAWATSSDIADLKLICLLPKPVSVDDVVDQIRRCLDVAEDAQR